MKKITLVEISLILFAICATCFVMGRYSVKAEPLAFHAVHGMNELDLLAQETQETQVSHR
jgi:hypothetical protein